MVADLESGKEIDENTELRPQEQKNDCYTKEELLGKLILFTIYFVTLKEPSKLGARPIFNVNSSSTF